jgi:hypothetical protein
VLLDINTWEGQEIKAQIVLLIRQLNYQLAKAVSVGVSKGFYSHLMISHISKFA